MESGSLHYDSTTTYQYGDSQVHTINGFIPSVGFTLSAPCSQIVINTPTIPWGDWLQFDYVEIVSGGSVVYTLYPTNYWWPANPPAIYDAVPPTVNLDANYNFVSGSPMYNKAHLQSFLSPWLTLNQLSIGVMMQEFGASTPTPHAVMIAYFKDLLSCLADTGIGWSMWCWSADQMGLIDSGRTDIVLDNVTFPDSTVHTVDTALLHLLQSY